MTCRSLGCQDDDTRAPLMSEREADTRMHLWCSISLSLPYSCLCCRRRDSLLRLLIRCLLRNHSSINQRIQAGFPMNRNERRQDLCDECLTQSCAIAARDSPLNISLHVASLAAKTQKERRNERRSLTPLLRLASCKLSGFRLRKSVGEAADTREEGEEEPHSCREKRSLLFGSEFTIV